MAWIDQLRKFRKKRPTRSDSEHTYHEMIAIKNDRGAALVASAQLEARLRQFIEARVRVHDAKLVNGLFGGSGPLSSFSSQTNIAYVFGFISDEIRRDMEILREVRNTFAHAGIQVTFETEEIVRACEGFSMKSFHYNDLPWGATHARTRYIGTSALLLDALTSGMAVNAPVPLPYSRHYSLLKGSSTKQTS